MLQRRLEPQSDRVRLEQRADGVNVDDLCRVAAANDAHALVQRLVRLGNALRRNQTAARSVLALLLQTDNTGRDTDTALGQQL